MPISPEMLARYPEEWPVISLWVRVLAGWQCQHCGTPQGKPNPVSGTPVILSCAHILNPEPEDVRPCNLGALCQRCHLLHDQRLHLATRNANFRAAANTPDIFEESIGL